MKNLVTTCMLLASILLSLSCEDYLEKKPLGETLLGSISSEEEAVLFTNAAYEPLLWGRPDPMQGHYFNDAWVLGDLASDDTESPVDPNNSTERAIQDFNIFPDNPNLRDWFGSAYSGIARCNLVIDGVSKMPASAFKNAGVKDRCLGEAYFLRGLYYFDLVKVFGGVPLIEQPITTIEGTQVARATDAQTWAFVEKDLTTAAGLLPSVKTYRNSANIGRATKGAATALLAKVYLYQQKWAESVKAAEAVMNSGDYELNADYLAQFNNQNDQNTIESIFEVQAYRTGGWGGGTEISLDFGRWGFNNPTKELVAAYEPGDPRLGYTIFKPGDNRFGQVYDGKNGPSTVTGFLARKYVFDPATVGAAPNGWTGGEGVNYVVLRYGELLLIHAEALIEQNQRLQEAVDDINKVRARPGVNMPPVKLSGQQDLRERLRHERRVELALEGHRFFDMIRWGEAYAAPLFTAQGKTNFQFKKHKIFPIPQAEIDLNPLLTQN
ncbi:RagB/SusD family nutrient uptake outer membrane protein [Dyadobacter alkalitolerans]|uniref:RagB/SusD family nutrient uptake outer membrane protein n=1 Tax=Dyadobacter alkalitolerans TaxID=492736 RepID=UPI0003FC74EF|nr:RagB/SusD family nutrient uptake outer membrane protein [Dyadobacter alkalitolerans]